MIRPFVLALGVASCARIVGIADVEPQDAATIDGPDAGSGSACPTWGGAGCVTSLAAGDDTTCVTTTIDGTTDNRVYCWGASPADGSAHTQPVRDLSGPPFTVSASAEGFAGVYCVVGNGSAQCWGDGVDGQLQTTSPSAVPMTMVGSDWAAIAAGGDHVCALDSTGSVACWGADNFDQLGSAATTQMCGSLMCSRVPLIALAGQVDQLGAGDSHTCALVGSSVECWGANNFGQLGVPTISQSGMPQTVVDGNLAPIRAVTLAVGATHDCALGSDGAFACWGGGANGQLGSNSFDSTDAPSYQKGFSFTAIAAGAANTCAIDGSSHVWCWGDNASGVDGAIPALMGSAVLPTQISVAGALRIAVGTRHACALLQSGEIACWGDNTHGELGGSGGLPCGSAATCSASPILVPGPM